MKVGDYVRTKNYGIKKVLNIYSEDKIELDKTNAFGILGVCENIENIIGKPSPNIIDLIEVGDYVNGYQVIEKPYMYHDIQFVSVDTQDSWSWGKGEMPVENIKSIVTKEQFESMEYKVGD